LRALQVGRISMLEEPNSITCNVWCKSLFSA
jgi:hypothetical protein